MHVVGPINVFHDKCILEHTVYKYLHRYLSISSISFNVAVDPNIQLFKASFSTVLDRNVKYMVPIDPNLVRFMYSYSEL